jgi:hypothetical protein
LEPFRSSFPSERFQRARKGPTVAPPGTQKPGSACFRRFLGHLSVPRRGALSGRRRQRRGALRAPPHHASKPPPHQMALRHQEPVVMAGTGPNILPVAVFSTLVSAPARLSRSRPSVASVHRGAARHQPHAHLGWLRQLQRLRPAVSG